MAFWDRFKKRKKMPGKGTFMAVIRADYMVIGTALIQVLMENYKTLYKY